MLELEETMEKVKKTLYKKIYRFFIYKESKNKLIRKFINEK